MSGRGSTHLQAYQRGRTLTPRQSILAKCAECVSDYIDGREDCEVQGCPLYPFMPYGKAPRKKKATRLRKEEGSNIRAASFPPRKRTRKHSQEQGEANP